MKRPIIKRIKDNPLQSIKSNQFKEITDEGGNSIKGIKGIEIYKGDLVVFTENAIYSNSKEIKKAFKTFDK